MTLPFLFRFVLCSLRSHARCLPPVLPPVSSRNLAPPGGLGKYPAELRAQFIGLPRVSGVSPRRTVSHSFSLWLSLPWRFFSTRKSRATQPAGRVPTKGSSIHDSMSPPSLFPKNPFGMAQVAPRLAAPNGSFRERGLPPQGL